MSTDDQQEWARLDLMAQPIPLDPSRGHSLVMADWRVVDGGVVVYRYQAFCTCHWSQRFPCDSEATARLAYDEHAVF